MGEPFVETLESQSNVVRGCCRGSWVRRRIDVIRLDLSQRYAAEFPVNKFCGGVDRPGSTMPLTKRRQSGARFGEQPSL